MVFEAAARGKPVVALLWPGEADPGLARVCADEDVSRGWLTAARTLQEHTAAIGSLATPLTNEQRASALAIVRPHGPDLLPGFLLSQALQEVVDRRAEMPPAPPARLGRVSCCRRWQHLRSGARSAACAERWQPRGSRARCCCFGKVAVSASTAAARSCRARHRDDRLHGPSTIPRRAVTTRSNATSRASRLRVCSRNAAVPGLNVCVRCLAYSVLHRLLIDAMPRTPFRRAGAIRGNGVAGPCPTRRVTDVACASRGALLSRAARTLGRLIPSSAAARQMVLDQHADVVAMLPDDEAVAAVESAGAQLDLIGAAESLGVPVIAAAGASEGRRSRSRCRERASCVWNDEQRRAAVDLGVPADRLVITGALPLDRALCEDPIVEDQSFREMLGLPRDRPFVFFVGSSGLMSEPAEEVELIRTWVRSLRTSADSMLRQLAVLIRPSPLGISRWRRLENEIGGGIVLCPRTFERSGELGTVLLAESVRFAALTIEADPLTLLMAAGLGHYAALVLPPRFVNSSDAIPLDYLVMTEGTSIRYTSTLADLSACARRVVNGAQSSSSSQFRRAHLQPQNVTPAVAVADCIETSSPKGAAYADQQVDAMRLPVLFDGGCPMCRRTARIMRALDWNDRLQFVSATNAEARAFFAPTLTEREVMIEMYRDRRAAPTARWLRRLSPTARVVP